jgi:hypothetical protein
MTTIRLPYPHKGQQQVRRQARRFNWLAAGRRWRKTTLVMAIAVESAIAGRRIIWGAPTYQQVRIGFNETHKATIDIADFNQSRMEIIFPTGGAILYRSLDNPDSARGETADGVVIDECGDVNPLAWHEVLRPMLIDTGGWLWAIGTPKGRNWFFQEHVAARSRDDSMTWQVPTVGAEIVDGRIVRKPHPMENPDLSFDEVANLWYTMPERTFRQEIMSEFIEGSGAVFRNIEACMHAKPTTPHAHRDHTLVMGADWGKQADMTALSLGCVECKCEVAHDRFNQIDYAFQRARLTKLVEQWGVAAVLAESNAMGDPIVEELQRAGLPVIAFQTTAVSKPPLIENLALAFERAEWQFLADPIWTGELESYERKVSALTGRSSYSAPQGLHDDTVMARALMLWQATNSSVSLLLFGGNE